MTLPHVVSRKPKTNKTKNQKPQTKNQYMKKHITIIAFLLVCVSAFAQVNVKIYNEDIDPDVQITEAVARASKEGKHVVAQLGGNWCKWCIRFARFVESDPEIKSLVDANYEFIHVNYNPREEESGVRGEATRRALTRLGNPTRFGYPVLVVLDGEGNVIHTQDSVFLESGEGYDREKVLRFFRLWTPEALK